MIADIPHVRIIAMSAPYPPVTPSPKRSQLCSRVHAQRIAMRMFDAGARQVSIVRTGDPLQPFRVLPVIVDGPNVEVELRYA
ncbi:hypothetical protein GGR88_002971 [Sphingomonas jejuensis]|uniref:Uncharacterized protein n=1 Tax=Sphingomonas jejuensis TaxID=904715 RepID=A0ABX0XPW9_9SPHN|nr:hypothetical protein [Sphingomonas jejuensis]